MEIVGRSRIGKTEIAEAKDTLDRLMDQLARLGMNDVREMVPMMLRECEAEDLVSRFGKGRNTISQRFYRGMRKAAAAAGIRR